ncbi:hypothetical protein Nepgr_012045 [Nepenthes gracilis]|uniref:Uncharacterized protein n=1 Tax=Nepenthes gracilis TaxID=150966 RepID=A0AAD3SGF1_NEPGR|nr:hypothetical protein Nepgr_012045 [Nepenthes gracilis]
MAAASHLTVKTGENKWTEIPANKTKTMSYFGFLSCPVFSGTSPAMHMDGHWSLPVSSPTLNVKHRCQKLTNAYHYFVAWNNH